ncbi:MAG: hypothetical protein JHD26_04465 [Gemmataceae bacterium]|jgi:MFS family permease|nr:hypothetical protein [Gemmataceae bacterium]
MQKNFGWLFYVILAGLAWGTYVPIVFYGGRELTTERGTLGGRLTSILCVGMAYFVLAVLIPLVLFLTKQQAWPQMKKTGLIFSGLAGVMGALGAISVIFASKAAVDAANALGQPENTYRIYIAPLIFGLAPVINTLVSLFWHPKPDQPWHFGLEKVPGYKLFLGIILVGVGAFLVLYSKEVSEIKPAAPIVAPSTSAVAEDKAVEKVEFVSEWIFFVVLAGLAWGTYVPIIFYGGLELTGKPGELGGRLMSILCVGLAYFLMAVLIPAGLMGAGIPSFAWPSKLSTPGLVFSSLAGVAGAVGAICVIFASKAAVDSAKKSGLPPASFRVYIAPLIFGLAPVINTLVSLLWHPSKNGDFLHFGMEHTPGPLLWIGIISVASGAFLVLLSKEQSEVQAGPPAAKPNSAPAR